MPYNEYPQAASDNAQRALDFKAERDIDCGTAVGWARANQLANREEISDEIVVRTFSFLVRAKVYDTGEFVDADGNVVCGSVMYAAWGGDPMMEWCEDVMEDWNDDEESKLSRAAADELFVGDFVRWNTSTGFAYGRIVQVESNGDLTSTSGFSMTGTNDDPVALVRIYDFDADANEYVERRPELNVVHRFSTLTKYDDEQRGSAAIVERRAVSDIGITNESQRTVRGYAALFNSESEDLGGFIELIKPGAFDEAMNDDVRALFNHDPNYLLGRTTSGTLKLFVDARGLGYEYDSPETTYANDLLELMRRGDVTQSSFGFTVKKDTWIQRGNVMFRFIEKVGRLYDVSPVTYPAYPATTVGIANRNSIPNDDLQREPIEQSADGNTETPIEAFRIRLIKTQI